MATRPPKNPETKPAAQAEARPVSFDINHPLIQQAIQQAVATAMAAKAAEIPATRSEKSQQLEFLTLKNFKKAGYKDVKPRENVKTYNLWIAAGRKVKPGETRRCGSKPEAVFYQPDRADLRRGTGCHIGQGEGRSPQGDRNPSSTAIRLTS
jgi:hypothetical protein